VAGAAAGAIPGPLLLVDGHDLDRSPEPRGWLGDRRGTFESVRLAGGGAAITAATEQRVRETVDR
jgi:hypothetical protein